ncbi:MAG TPA: hypothetical protein VF887_08990, partial [Gemmatimonadaceae bacterium]
MSTSRDDGLEESAVPEQALNKEELGFNKDMSRRDAVQVLAALPLAAFLSWPTAEQEKVRNFVDRALRR